jgi:hypothetical protein
MLLKNWQAQHFDVLSVFICPKALSAAFIRYLFLFARKKLCTAPKALGDLHGIIFL